MLKTKIFSVASALTLLVAISGSGCGNEEKPGAASAANSADKDKSPNNGSSGSSGGGGGTEAEPGCPSKEEIDLTKLPYKPPKVTKNACTQADLDGLVKFVSSNADAKYPQWKSSVTNQTCRDCIFGKDGSTWPPLVESSSGDLAILNVGGCVGIASGNESCGKAYQNWVDCRFKACAGCGSKDVTGVQRCLSAASTGACKPAFDSVGSICGEKVIADAEAACKGDQFVFEGPIKAQCIGGTPTGTTGTN